MGQIKMIQLTTIYELSERENSILRYQYSHSYGNG